MNVTVPAALVAAPASGQGKTTVTAALALHHRRQGRRVRVLKMGPDYLDPKILAAASGAAVYQLDLWMMGEVECRRLLVEAAMDADVILVEGVMGLYDGAPSAAELAIRLGLPVLLLIDASAMAQTFGAVALGLAAYEPGLRVAGVVANRVAGPGHERMLRESLPGALSWYGALHRDSSLALPERHLGLHQAEEVSDLLERLERGADALAKAGAGVLPPPAELTIPQTEPPPPLLAGVRIGIARDRAFPFIYPANVDLLLAMGAELEYFSPLTDTELPAVDSLWLPGGYPELYLERLSGNTPMREAVAAHGEAGLPILAECGGMLYLLERLADINSVTAPMVGLLAGEARLQPGLQGLGMHVSPLPEGEIRGHSFHHTTAEMRLSPLCQSRPARRVGRAEPIYRTGRVTASYLHHYFPSNPEAVAALLHPQSS